HDAIEHVLGSLGRNRDDRDLGALDRDVVLEASDVANLDSLQRATDLFGVRVVDGDDVVAALAEAPILRERGADLSGADDHDAPLAAEAEDLAECRRELGHGIPQSSLPERPEEREVLPHLRGGRSTTSRQLIAGNRGESPILEFLEESQVDRK